MISKKLNNDYILELKKYLPDYLLRYHNINTNDFFHCLNETHPDNNPSMKYSKKYNICKCYGCGVRYDIFDLVKIDFGCNNFVDQVNKLSEIYNQYTPFIYEEESKDYQIIDFTNYFKKCNANISKTDYLDYRGISKELIDKYFIGYDEKNRRIIFPINKNSYVGRNTEDNFKMKSKGKSYLWNECNLENCNSESIVYVTEGIFDALSLETIERDIKTISLNGVNNKKRLIELLKENNFHGLLILMFDKNYAGKNAQDELSAELKEIGFKSFSITGIENFDCEDLNEALIIDKEKLEKNIKYYNDIFQKIIDKIKKEELNFE